MQENTIDLIPAGDAVAKGDVLAQFGTELVAMMRELDGRRRTMADVAEWFRVTGLGEAFEAWRRKRDLDPEKNAAAPSVQGS